MTGKTISRYAVLEKLGEGGMGEVYKARDLHLDRFVALKFLPQRLESSAEAEDALDREVTSISSLNHPHIATIYDSDKADSRKFLVLEYLPGGTLRSKLSDLQSTAQELSAQEAVRYAIQIAEALAHAHRWGVLHLDLKPENVMFTADGAVKLTDFGLGEWKGGSTTQEAPKGTPAYVSPEQAEGRELDQRSDVFSFGVVLFEMLAGRVPFEAEDETTQLYEVLRLPTPSLKGIRDDLPRELYEIVETALEKDPGRRYPQFEALLRQLRSVERELEADTRPSPRRGKLTSLLSGLGGFFAGAGGADTYERAVAEGAPAEEATASDASTEAASIAVLPFVNMTRVRENDYLSDGLTEELIRALTKVPRLRVVAPATAFQFRGKSQDTLLIREQLGVDAILDGSVRSAGEKLRVNAKLINARDGSYVWSEAYERKMADVFRIQEEIADAIVNQLKLHLVEKPQPRLSARRTRSLDAYQLYLQGRYYWNKQTPLALQKCIRCFQDALARDPDFALAHAGLADAYNLMGTWAMLPPHEVMRKAKEAAIKAEQIDESLAEAHTALGFVKAVYDWEWEDARREYELALELNPGYATARHAYAMSWMAPTGRLEEAIQEIERAQTLDPLSLFINANYGLVLYLSRQYERAVAQYQRTLELEPNYSLAHLYLGWTYTQQGKHAEALDALEKSRTLSGDSAFMLGALGQAYALAGKTDDARGLLAGLETKARRRYVSPLSFAGIYFGLGDTKKGFHCLEKAYEDRSSWLILMNVDPIFEALRPHPRFRELLRKVGFANDQQ